MFSALSQCQLLHPDPAEDSEEEEEERGLAMKYCVCARAYVHVCVCVCTCNHTILHVGDFCASCFIVFGAGEYFVSNQDIDQLTPEGQVSYTQHYSEFKISI